MTALSSDQLRQVISAAGFTGADADIAFGVAMAESGGNPSATHVNSNGTTDHGLFQINDVNVALAHGGNLNDPNVNAQVAYALFKRDGWHPWTTYNTGAYRKYLTMSTSNPVTTAPDSGTASAPAPAPATGTFAPFINAFNSFTTRLAFSANVAGALILGIVLVIVGLTIVARRPALSVISPMGKVGSAIKVASKVAG